MRSRPWSDRRQPFSWKKSMRACSAAFSSANVAILASRALAQARDVFGEIGLFDGDGLVRPPGGQHAHGEARVRGQEPVVPEVVRRVVRRAHELDVGPLDQGAGAHVLALQLFPAQVPDLLGGVRARTPSKPK